jgi:glycine/D-amino acid oxidase-like deaminating enzyme
LVAERLTRQGLDVVIVDREFPGHGSTAASTSMLLWEIDQPLRQLSEVYGFERAARAYRASFDAVAGLKSLVGQLGIACDMRAKNSLCLAAGDSSGELLEEHRLRERATLPGDFLDHGMLLDRFGFARAGAIVSPGAADADPIQLAHGLLGLAAARGARLFEGEALAFDAAGRSVGVRLANDSEIEARSVVLATGYVMPDIVHCTVHAVSSSWTIATVPQPQNVWKDDTLIWEDAKDYLYARTTRAGRIIIGGEDSTEIVEPEARDRLIPQKSRLLAQRLAALWPAAGDRHRVSLVRHIRYHERRLAPDRAGPRRQGCLCGLRLWRQRDHIQFSRRMPDRRSDRRKNLAIAGRLRDRSRRRQDRLKHGYPLKNGYGNGLPWARDVGLSNEVY